MNEGSLPGFETITSIVSGLCLTKFGIISDRQQTAVDQSDCRWNTANKQQRKSFRFKSITQLVESRTEINKLTFKDFDISLDETETWFALVLTRACRDDTDLRTFRHGVVCSRAHTGSAVAEKPRDDRATGKRSYRRLCQRPEYCCFVHQSVRYLYGIIAGYTHEQINV